MIAAYNFALDNGGYGDREICVQAESYGEAKDLAEQMLVGSKMKIGELRKVVDARLMVNNTNVMERQVIVEQNVKHSGAITEYKGEANPTKAEGIHALTAGK